MQYAIVIGSAFQQAHRRCADSNYPPSVPFGFIDNFAGFGSNNTVFGVHLMVFGIFRFHGQKRSGADMQGQKYFGYALFIKFLQYTVGKMQSGRRRGNCPFIFCIYSLIIFLIIVFIP